MPAANGAQAIDPSGVALATLMGEHTPLLRSILAELRSDLVDIAVSDSPARELVLDQFPAPGSKRLLVNRTGNGYASLAVPAPPAGVLALGANEARLGLTLINTGAVPVGLYLSDQPRNGVPVIWLAAAGGAWDGRFGNLTWSGNVYAVGLGGASTLSGGEL